MSKKTLIKPIVIGLIICLVIIIAITIYHKQSSHKVTPTDNTIATVTVQTFAKTTAPLTVSAYGTTVSLQSVIVSAKHPAPFNVFFSKPVTPSNKGNHCLTYNPVTPTTKWLNSPPC